MRVVCLMVPHLPVRVAQRCDPGLEHVPVIVGGRRWDDAGGRRRHDAGWRQRHDPGRCWRLGPGGNGGPGRLAASK